MKYQKHYLSEKGNDKYCPFKMGVSCDSHCAWFDHEELDCRKILTQKNILYELRNIDKTIFDGFDALFQKN